MLGNGHPESLNASDNVIFTLGYNKLTGRVFMPSPVLGKTA
jgi:hypothetical protein